MLREMKSEHSNFGHRSSRILPYASPMSEAFRYFLCGSLIVALVGCSPSVDDKLEEVRELQAANRMEESLPILTDLIESGDRTGEILYRYGRALSITGQRERSVWALDAARDDPEWFVRASQQLAIDAHAAGNFEFAMEVFKRLHEQTPGEVEDDLYALLLEARVLLDSQEHFEEALDLIESIIDRFPEEETAIRMKAVALLALKRPDEAYDLLRAANVAPATFDENSDEKSERESDDETKAQTGETVTDAGDGESDSGSEGLDELDPLYPTVEDEAREAYWCAVRVSFKREANEIEEAMKIADECLDRFPADTGLISQAVKLYAETERHGRIRAILEKASEKNPENREIRTALIQFLGRLGLTKEVEKILRKSIDVAVAEGRGSSVETASDWVELAGFLMEHDRVGEALLAFDSANDIIGDSASPDLLLREAEALIRAKEFDQALAMANKTPVEVHGNMLRGRIAFERGDFSKALEELGHAALIWPNNAPIRYYRARALEARGEFDQAIEEYRQAIRSDGSLSEARENLAKLHLAEGNFREAAGILAFESPRNPSTPSTKMRILMVEVATMRGDEPNLDIAPTPDYPTERVRADAIRALARGLSRRTNEKVAAGVLAELEKASVAPIRGAFLRERVGLLVASGNAKVAVSEARKGLAARPDDSDSQFALARALVASGDDLEAADRLLRGVLETSPKDVDAWTCLGDLEALRGNRAKADEGYDRALGLAPDHWEAFHPRVESLFQSGESKEALSRLETFVATVSPYDGRGALLLAQRLPVGEATLERRSSLARRAVRFNGGEAAMELIAELAPPAQDEVEQQAPIPQAK